MLYATATFWLIVIVFTAWGVHELWSAMVKPRAVNSVLLPGTLVAQIGHVLGLLVTGATVNNTTLYKDDDTGAPETTKDAKPRIPIVGPMIVGLLPLLACAVALFLVARFLGGPIVGGTRQNLVPRSLPTTLPAFWDVLRGQITLVENLVTATINSDWRAWQVWLFSYLLICLTVRMAPFPGTLRGTLGAIVLLGLGAAGVGALTPSMARLIGDGWGVLSLSVAALTFLLFASLAVRGLVGLIKILASRK